MGGSSDFFKINKKSEVVKALSLFEPYLFKMLNFLKEGTTFFVSCFSARNLINTHQNSNVSGLYSLVCAFLLQTLLKGFAFTWRLHALTFWIKEDKEKRNIPTVNLLKNEIVQYHFVAHMCSSLITLVNTSKKKRDALNKNYHLKIGSRRSGPVKPRV